MSNAKVNSTAIAQLLSKAEEFEENDKLEQAYECYKSAYSSNKSDEEVLSRLAICAQSLNKCEDALSYWQSLLELNPENTLPYTQMMDIYFHCDKFNYYLTRAKLKTTEGRLEQATVDYKKALSNTTDEQNIVTARYLLAQTYEIIEKPMQAIDEYLRILDYQHNEQVYTSLASIYYNTDKSAAVSVLRQALNEFPDNIMFKELLSKIYMELGDYPKALEFATNNLSKAKILLLQEKNDEAMSVLSKISDKEKSQSRYFALMAEYYYNTDNDLKAVEYITKYQTAEPESPLPYQMKALVYEKQRNEYEEHYNWGKYYLKKGSPDMALNEFLTAHRYKAESKEAISEIINLYTAMEENHAVVEFSEKLVLLEKDNIPALKKLVKFYEEQGYQDKVVEYLTVLNEINPKDYETLYKLAKYHESERRTGEALEYYKKYLKFAPTSDEREKVENKVKIYTEGGVIEEEEGFLDKLLGFFTKR